MPGAPSSFLLLAAMPFAPSSLSHTCLFLRKLKGFFGLYETVRQVAPVLASYVQVCTTLTPSKCPMDGGGCLRHVFSSVRWLVPQSHNQYLPSGAALVATSSSLPMGLGQSSRIQKPIIRTKDVATPAPQSEVGMFKNAGCKSLGAQTVGTSHQDLLTFGLIFLRTAT